MATKFSRHLSVDEVQAACEVKGFTFDRAKYDAGSDYVRVQGEVEGQAVDALYSSFNGRFFGKTASGIEFNSGSTDYDDQPWFDALLNFFYVA
ncbi:hypothetical protein ACPRNU_14075 [Chromobacterium vaccinii]|uniref:hypothetical protein n=1 Tax=Chromobacterium vaccinii TaxID=1108595 RepID=UPI003C7554D3